MSNKKPITIFLLAALPVVIVLGYYSFSYFTQPRFTVINSSSEQVVVRAHWREEERVLGQLAPGKSITFTVNDEAAMSFTAEFPSGDKLESTGIYFTTSTKVIAEISAKEIKVQYGFET